MTENVEEIYEFLQANYKDRYQYRPKNELIIHYPELTITNDQGDSHTIYDMYVKIKIDNADGIMGLPSGVRTSYSKLEYSNGFSHPYLPGIYQSFRNFCLGRTDLSKYGSLYFNLTNLEMFLFEFEGYLRWSGTAAGPYRTIRDLRNRNVSGGNPIHINDNVLNAYYIQFMQDIDMEALQLVEDDNKMKLVHNEYMKNYIEGVCLNEHRGYIMGNYCYESLYTLPPNDVILSFNDKDIRTKIIDSDEQQPKEPTMEIFNYIARALGININNKIQLKKKYKYVKNPRKRVLSYK